MAFISSLFLSELTFQRSSVVKAVVKGMTSSFQFFENEPSVHKTLGRKQLCPFRPQTGAKNGAPRTQLLRKKALYKKSITHAWHRNMLCVSLDALTFQ